jgi:tetratricopeptide (TPR) repeat protein
MKQKILLLLIFNLYLIIGNAQNADSISREAFLSYKNKDYSNAIMLYDVLQKTNEISEKDLFILGKVLYAQERYSDAILIFNELSLKSDTAIKASYWLANAYCCIDSSDSYASAKPYFERFLERAKADTLNNLEELLLAYHYFGSYYLFSGSKNLDLAIFYLEKLISLSSSNTEYLLKGYLGLSLVYSQMHDSAKAKIYEDKVSGICSKHPIDAE